ncbi:MAG: Uma2 family endonuclease [Burkholderiaceae bacterium]|nr:Uma2 family endonuclease [Burkholderiaceae bacterium]
MFTVDIPALSRSQAAARWLQLSPLMPEDGRAEMDQYGELLLAPLPSNRHQVVASEIALQLRAQLGGTSATSIAINTRIGVRVPDVCWTAAVETILEDPASRAPEICIEVASAGNTEKWLLEKAAAYLDAGAKEVILIELGGRIRYFDASGERADSAFGLRLSLPKV